MPSRFQNSFLASMWNLVFPRPKQLYPASSAQRINFALWLAVGNVFTPTSTPEASSSGLSRCADPSAPPMALLCVGQEIVRAT